MAEPALATDGEAALGSKRTKVCMTTERPIRGDGR